MNSYEKLAIKLMSGAADADVRFTDLRRFLRHLGFEETVRGDHHIFTRDNLEEILNLQPREGRAKPYQVRQVSRLMSR